MAKLRAKSQEIERIRRARRALDMTIDLEIRRPLPDFSRVSALKRRRLALKDRLFGIDKRQRGEERSPLT